MNGWLILGLVIWLVAVGFVWCLAVAGSFDQDRTPPYDPDHFWK